jgi:hypothetical protein
MFTVPKADSIVVVVVHKWRAAPCGIGKQASIFAVHTADGNAVKVEKRRAVRHGALVVVQPGLHQVGRTRMDRARTAAVVGRSFFIT